MLFTVVNTVAANQKRLTMMKLAMVNSNGINLMVIMVITRGSYGQLGSISMHLLSCCGRDSVSYRMRGSEELS